MFKCAILDIDGVLFRGKETIPGSLESVKRLSDNGISIGYLTNNSTRTRREVLFHLTSAGFPKAPVVTSGHAAAGYAMKMWGQSVCFMIGEIGLRTELESLGHEVLDIDDMAEMNVEPGYPDFVVCSMDRAFSYQKLSIGLEVLREGADFLATNRDPTLPIEGGRVLPGSGSILASLETASGIEPVVVGKPNSFIVGMLLDEIGMEADDSILIGDRPDTDIMCGLSAGCDVALVLSGDVKENPFEEVDSYRDLHAFVEKLGL